MILEVEKFKASIAPPIQGKEIDKLLSLLRKNLDNDDDFFHLTCHIDKNLRAKIANGEFVDLEKLLPSDRRRPNDENFV